MKWVKPRLRPLAVTFGASGGAMAAGGALWLGTGTSPALVPAIVVVGVSLGAVYGAGFAAHLALTRHPWIATVPWTLAFPSLGVILALVAGVGADLDGLPTRPASADGYALFALTGGYAALALAWLVPAAGALHRRGWRTWLLAVPVFPLSAFATLYGWLAALATTAVLAS